MAKNYTSGLLPFSAEDVADRASAWLRRYWFRMLIGALGLYLVLTKDITIQVTMGSPGNRQEQERIVTPVMEKTERIPSEEIRARPARESDREEEILNSSSLLPEEQGDRRAEEGEPSGMEYPVSNLKFVLEPSYAWWHGIDDETVKEKWLKCAEYIDQYALVAVAERRRFGIPASVIIAQGLLESDAGASRVAVEQNNHFSLRCRGPFASPSKSYRKHSELLTGPRFGHLLRHGETNYKKWAYGLQRAGYAEERGYGKKLIRIIEEFELQKLDKL